MTTAEILAELSVLTPRDRRLIVERINELDAPKDVSRPDAASCSVEWTEEKNARRCLLVDREIDGKLTTAERRELKALQAELSRYRQAVAPLPIKELRGIFDQLRDAMEQPQAQKGR